MNFMYTIKELEPCMNSLTLTLLPLLRKTIGFMKAIGDVGLLLHIRGRGKPNAGGTCRWVLERYTDADRGKNKTTRKSTSCRVHYINGCFISSGSRSQTDFTELLREWTSQPHYQNVCAIWIGGPVGARCLHRCQVNEAIDLQTGIREGTSPFWKIAVGTRENCEGKFSISPGANTMQHSWHRYKHVEQTEVVRMNADWSTLLSSRESVQATSLVQNKKLVKSKRLKQITKAILRMNIAMRITGGLEPARPFWRNPWIITDSTGWSLWLCSWVGQQNRWRQWTDKHSGREPWHTCSSSKHNRTRNVGRLQRQGAIDKLCDTWCDGTSSICEACWRKKNNGTLKNCTKNTTQVRRQRMT
jgi:hypothetical protein